MTYKEIKKNFKKDLEKQGIYNLKKVKDLTQREILEGYRDLEEAKEMAKIMIKSGNVSYTARGYEINGKVILTAIREAKKWSKSATSTPSP